MSKLLEDRKRMAQITINRIYSLYDLAKNYGYKDSQAKQVALQCINRKFQGGLDNFVEQIQRIIARTATGGRFKAETYNQIMKNRNPRLVPLDKNFY